MSAGTAGRAGTLALSGYYFAYFAYVGAYSPYITLYLKDIGLAAAQIGFLYSIPQVMRIFGPGVWGQVADRTGRPTLILRWAAALSLTAFLGVYAGTAFWWLFTVLVAMHFFTSAQMPLIEAITLDHVRERPGDYGPIRVWGSISFIISVLGLGVALDHFSTTVVLHVTVALLLVTAVVAWSVPAPAHHANAADRSPLKIVLARPEVRAFLAAGFCNAFAHAALYAFYSLYLASRGYDKSVIGLMWAIGIILEVAVFRGWPVIVRRFALREMFFATFVIGALRFAVIGWGADHWWLLVVAQVMHAATFAVYHASAVALVREYFGAAGQARGQGLYISFSFGCGGFAGALTSGLLWESAGPAWTFSVSALACAAGCAVFARHAFARVPA